MALSICIFAHNDEKFLVECVGALDHAIDDLAYHAHIIIRGSHDHTASVAKSLAAADSRLSVHEMAVPDKANAWNDYVFRVAPDAHTHIFLNADTRPSDNAISILDATLREHPRAFAAAALPATGRSRRQWTTNIFMKRQLSGNLYALSNAAIQQFREKSIHLPNGIIGEDGLIAYLLLTDLNCGRDDSHDHRIVTSGAATFEFQPLRLRPRDLEAYHKRMIKNAERYFQQELLFRRLKQGSRQDIPQNIDEVYAPDALARLRPRRTLINYWYDIAILKQLRRAVQ